MKGFQIHGWRRGIGTSLSPEYTGSPFEQLRLPLGDPIGMDVELLGQFGDCPLALDRGQSHFCLESRRVVPVVVCSLSLLLHGRSCHAQAETPLMPLSKLVRPPLLTSTRGRTT